jgi:hypothetical protein
VIAVAAEMKPVGALKNSRIMMVVHYYTTTSFAKKSGDGDAESLLFLTYFMPPVVSFVSVMSLM